MHLQRMKPYLFESSVDKRLEPLDGADADELTRSSAAASAPFHKCLCSCY